MVQRVPFIVDSRGCGAGQISKVYGGQIDILPTVMHLLGVDTSAYVQLGQDLMSAQNEGIVTFRNGTIVTSEYTILGNTVYHTQTGTLAYQTEEVIQKVAEIRAQAELQLAISDQIINGDLLRFYTPDGFVPVDKSLHNYVNSPAELEEDIAELGDLNTSLYYTNNGVSSVPLYQTDAPEFPANQAAAEGTVMEEQPASEETQAEEQTEPVE